MKTRNEGIKKKYLVSYWKIKEEKSLSVLSFILGHNITLNFNAEVKLPTELQQTEQTINSN